MSNNAKKVISLLLVFCLSFSIFTVASAAPADEGAGAAAIAALSGTLSEEDEKLPLIILPGISQSISYLSDKDGNPVKTSDGQELSGGLLFIDTSGLVFKVLTKLLVPLLVTLISQRDSLGFTDRIYDFACDLFSTQGSKPDGTTVNDIRTITYDHSVGEMSAEDRTYFYRQIPMQDLAQRIGEDKIYLFAFPLLGSPMDNAANLQDYIDMVRAKHGVDKVNLAAISMGGTVLTAWADYEGADYSSVNRIVNAVPVLNGTDIIGDLMERNFNLEDQFVFSDFIPVILESNGESPMIGYLANIIIRLFPRSVFENLLTRITDGILDTFVLNAPQFWAMVPKERYAGLAERYLDPDLYPEKAELKAKTDRFNEAQNNLEDNLLALNAAGAKIFNVCGYNLDFSYGDYAFFAIMDSTKTTNSDALIQIESTSLGATAAPAGQQLSEEYLATADPKYISPDKGVDASTALFKDTTWFYYNQHHEVGRTDLVLELTTEILTGHIDSVETDTVRFPQFIEGRQTKALTNAMNDAKNIISDPADYDASKIPTLVSLVAEAQDLLDNTYSGGQAKVDSLEASLRKAIAEAKGETYDSGDSMGGLLNFVFKVMNDLIFRFIGPVGFSDKTGYSQKQALKGLFF